MGKTMKLVVPKKWNALQDVGVLVPDLLGELNLNGIKWLKFHDKIIVLFLLNVGYTSVKKVL
jgi:hypothetical protein